eukprot:1222841-Prymnesium_polylepis.2
MQIEIHIHHVVIPEELSRLYLVLWIRYSTLGRIPSRSVSALPEVRPILPKLEQPRSAREPARVPAPGGIRFVTVKGNARTHAIGRDGAQRALLRRQALVGEHELLEPASHRVRLARPMQMPNECAEERPRAVCRVDAFGGADGREDNALGVLRGQVERWLACGATLLLAEVVHHGLVAETKREDGLAETQHAADVHEHDAIVHAGPSNVRHRIERWWWGQREQVRCGVRGKDDIKVGVEQQLAVDVCAE